MRRQRRVGLWFIWPFWSFMLFVWPGRTDPGRIQVEWLNKTDTILLNTRDALGFSRASPDRATGTGDGSRFRIRVKGGPDGPSVRISLVSKDPITNRVRDWLDLGALASDGQNGVTTPWLVLVAGVEDQSSPWLKDRALRAELGDLIQARVRIGGSKTGTWIMPVARPAHEKGPLAKKSLKLNTIVLRAFSKGPPIVGGDIDGARAVIEHQVNVLDEVFAQCAIKVGFEENCTVTVADPPGPCLLAVGQRFGLLSGGGHVRLKVNGKILGPWKIGAGYTPLQTARLLTHHLEDAGFSVQLSANGRLKKNAFGSADVLVRTPDGSLAEIEPWSDMPLTTDNSQSLSIGKVALADGIDSYDQNNTVSGTLEERTLIKALAKQDDGVVDVFIINRFSRPDKQGESFIRASGSSIKNAVLVDLKALGRARQSYTLSHEVGHVLLDDLNHPDARGNPETSLLMHSRSSSAMDGPKRLTQEECNRIRQVSEALLNPSQKLLDSNGAQR